MDEHTEYRHKLRRYRVMVCARAVRIIGIVVPILGLVYAVAVLLTPEGFSLPSISHVMHSLFVVVAFGVASFVASHIVETLGDIEENTRATAAKDSGHETSVGTSDSVGD